MTFYHFDWIKTLVNGMVIENDLKNKSDFNRNFLQDLGDSGYLGKIEKFEEKELWKLSNKDKC